MLVDFLGSPGIASTRPPLFWFTTLRVLPAFGQKLLPALYDFCANFCQLGFRLCLSPLVYGRQGADALCPLLPTY